jgi:hypothetical protein
MYTKALLAVILWAWLPAVQAAHTHARLPEGDHALESLIELPKKLEAGLHKVYCEAQIDPTGRIRRSRFHCYTLDDFTAYSLAKAVKRAGYRAQFVPGTRDGVATDVYMVFMVRVFVPAEGEPLILALPNNGAEEERYGLFYTAPQRFNQFVWGRSLPTKARSRRMILWQDLEIDEHGKITKTLVTGIVGASGTVISTLEEEIKSMEFMPGLVNGKPTPMRYREPAFKYRTGG